MMDVLSILGGLILLGFILAGFKRRKDRKQHLESSQNLGSKAYEIALSEIENDNIDHGIWTMAYAHTEDEESRKKYYVRERAAQLNCSVKQSDDRSKWPKRVMLILLIGLVLPTILIQMGYINNPTIKQAVGEGFIAAGAAGLILIPIWIIKKVRDARSKK